MIPIITSLFQESKKKISRAHMCAFEKKLVSFVVIEVKRALYWRIQDPDQTLQINYKILGLWATCVWGKFVINNVSTTRQNLLNS